MTKRTNNEVFRMLRKSHPNKSKRWVWRRYSTDQSVTYKTKTFTMKNERLYLPMFMPIKRFVPVKMGIRVFDNREETKVYWKKRAYLDNVKLPKTFASDLTQPGFKIIFPMCNES